MGAASIGFLAVTVTEAGVDPQCDRLAGRALAVLVDHVGRTDVDVDIVANDEIERFAVEDVGGVDNFGWMLGLARLVSRGDRAVNFASTYRIDQDAMPA